MFFISIQSRLLTLLLSLISTKALFTGHQFYIESTRRTTAFHPQLLSNTPRRQQQHHHATTKSYYHYPLFATAEDNDSSSSNQYSPPEILPFSPLYSTKGKIGNTTFIVSRTGEPTSEELSDSNLLKIIYLNSTDLEVNTLVWKCLGYRFNTETETWDNDEVFPNWKERYPTPPDLIGMQRIYSKEVDEPSLRSNQALIRSIPAEHKQSLKKYMKPLGFNGFKLAELTPNKTRRAQCTNWLLFYRENLFGYSVEELREKRRLKKEKEEEEKKKKDAEPQGEVEDGWKPPVKEVF